MLDPDPIENEPLPAWLTVQDTDPQDVFVLFVESWTPGVTGEPDEDE